MKPFVVCSSVAAVIDRDNIDTDMIIRIERMTSLRRGQFAPWAFEMLRYGADGTEDATFVLNQPSFRCAQILLAGANFGCGSSREMAVWALDDFGIRCVIASSFGDIFYNNCLQNGLLPIRLDTERLAGLMALARQGRQLTVDLRAGTVRAEGEEAVPFVLPADQREALLNGWDDVDQSIALSDRIDAFQAMDRRLRPWVYDVISSH